MTSTIDRAREACARYAWADAFELFGSVDATDALGPDDLKAMAECAWWIGKMRHCIALRERAHAEYLKAGNELAAARVAIDLADNHSDLVEASASAAWLQRAAKLLDGKAEGAEHGWFQLAQGIAHRYDPDESRMFAARASELGAQHGDKDLFALGLALQGISLVFTDKVDEGMGLIEEATIGAVSGDLGPFATGVIYCMMITASSQLADWQRAGKWTEAAKRWCDRQAINGFPGVCRVHRAEIMRLRGALSEAEDEARRATDELSSFNLYFTALAFKELGEVRLRMGETEAAEEAFRQAEEMGVTPQPGMALVQLQRGKPLVAARALRRALADESAAAPLERAKLLPTQVDVALLLDDLETARTAATDLQAIAESYSSPALHAAASAAIAAVRTADGELDEAESAARRAIELFTHTDLIYEAARSSLLLGQVHGARGHLDDSRIQISSALSTFERIGAVPEAQRARALLASVVPEPELLSEKVFLVTEVVRSSKLLDAVGDEAWPDVLAWHDETLRNVFAQHGGREAAHSAEGFFVAFDSAADAVACAIAIQSALEARRESDAFVPDVRIGLHATPAAEAGGTFHGHGVHEAARLGAVGRAGEIVASVATLVGVQTQTVDERDVILKGVDTPMQVVTVAWR